MKIALYLDNCGGEPRPIDSPQGERFAEYCGYVRVSEFVEVEFPMLASTEFADKRLAALAEAEAEARRVMDKKLEFLNAERARLAAAAA